MDIKLDWREVWVAWLLLGAAFLVVDLAVVTSTDANFNMGLVYAIACFDVAVMAWYASNERSTNVLAMLIGAIVGSLPLITAVADVALGFAGFAVYAGVIGIGAVILFNQRKIFGSEDSKASYLAAFPMLMWVVWALMFFYENGSQITIQTLLYHGGILAFSFYSLYRFFGWSDKQKGAKVTIVLLGISILGMLLLTQGLGAALSIWV